MEDKAIQEWRKHPLWNVPAHGVSSGIANPENVYKLRAGQIIESAGSLALFGSLDWTSSDEFSSKWPWSFSVPAQGILDEMLRALSMTQEEFVSAHENLVGGFRSVGLAERLRESLKVATDRDRLRIPQLVTRYELPVKLWDYIKVLSRHDTEALVVGMGKSEPCPMDRLFDTRFDKEGKKTSHRTLSDLERITICLGWLEGQGHALDDHRPVKSRVLLNWLAICHPDVFLDDRYKDKEVILPSTIISQTTGTESAAKNSQISEVLQWLRSEWLRLIKNPPSEFLAVHSEASVDNPIWKLIHDPNAKNAREAHSWAVWKLSPVAPITPAAVPITPPAPPIATVATEIFLSKSADRVWGLIQKRREDGQLSIPTYDDIENALQMARNTISQALSELKAKGFIPNEV